MKNLIALIVLAAIGGGAYIYFYNPELKEQITSKVKEIITGSDFHKPEKYREELSKTGLEKTGEDLGFVGGFMDELDLISYRGSGSDRLILAYDEQATMIISCQFKENDSSLEDFISAEYQRMFGKEPDFSVDDSIESKYAIAEWANNEGFVRLSIYRLDIEKLPDESSLPEEEQQDIKAFRELAQEKAKMEKEYDALDDELHFCFDKVRFDEISTRMKELKMKADEMSKTAKDYVSKIDKARVMLIKQEVEGSTL